MKKENKEIAVLLTCHNRKSKTLACLQSFFAANKPNNYWFKIYVVDDGSTDGTADAIKALYPAIHVEKGDGSLFWAGGMHLAWEIALNEKEYHAFLLLNDDVLLNEDFLGNLIATEEFALKKDGKTGVYSSATIDSETNEYTYGAYNVTKKLLKMRIHFVVPTNVPQRCQLTNANILWISKETVDTIGILDDNYTHAIADFDYSLRAIDKDIPVYLTPHFGGLCSNDHSINQDIVDAPLKERIAYLKSPKGLSCDEYLYYIRKHFPLFLPIEFTTLWFRTLFPKMWAKFKNK